LADKHIIAGIPAPIEELEHGLNGVILITGELDGDRTKPINDERLNWLHQFCGYHDIPLLIEADGSRQKPLKAWAEHEPPVPPFVKQVVEAVGLSGIGKPLDAEHVHRPEKFSTLSGLNIGGIVTPHSVTRVLLHEDGGLKNIPPNVRRSVLLNQADTAELQSVASNMAKSLLAKFDSVVVASLQERQIFAVHEPVAGIVLAAGESSRYGQPKQLLDWKGEPFVRVVARRALEAGLSPVVVVTGAGAERVEKAIEGLPVMIVRNEEWRDGQASSIRSGILSLTPSPLPLGEGDSAGACIFLLVDQPQITASVLRALVEKHALELQPILAPMVQDRRANPVLFDRVTFRDLLELKGDVGGRGIFHKHRVEYLPWHDDRLLLDVDTPEMYQRLITDDTL
jgi:molybdenum cofactor cytidylyltransferase